MLGLTVSVCFVRNQAQLMCEKRPIGVVSGQVHGFFCLPWKILWHHNFWGRPRHYYAHTCEVLTTQNASARLLRRLSTPASLKFQLQPSITSVCYQYYHSTSSSTLSTSMIRYCTINGSMAWACQRSISVVSKFSKILSLKWGLLSLPLNHA